MLRLALGLALALTACMSQTGQTKPPAQNAAATIVNTGSTNTAGFRIAVHPSGAAEYVSIPRGAGAQSAVPEKAARDIPADLAARLFTDLAAARPLSSLPAPHCFKSASFRYRLTIEFDGETTPDLSCGDGGNDHLRALISDVKQTVALFVQK
jgi:hypothetical protein